MEVYIDTAAASPENLLGVINHPISTGDLTGLGFCKAFLAPVVDMFKRSVEFWDCSVEFGLELGDADKAQTHCIQAAVVGTSVSNSNQQMAVPS